MKPRSKRNKNGTRDKCRESGWLIPSFFTDCGSICYYFSTLGINSAVSSEKGKKTEKWVDEDYSSAYTCVHSFPLSLHFYLCNFSLRRRHFCFAFACVVYSWSRVRWRDKVVNSFNCGRNCIGRLSEAIGKAKSSPLDRGVLLSLFSNFTLGSLKYLQFWGFVKFSACKFIWFILRNLADFDLGQIVLVKKIWFLFFELSVWVIYSTSFFGVENWRWNGLGSQLIIKERRKIYKWSKP